MENSVLRVKMLGLSTPPAEILVLLPDPPQKNEVELSILKLKEVGLCCLLLWLLSKCISKSSFDTSKFPRASFFHVEKLVLLSSFGECSGLCCLKITFCPISITLLRPSFTSCAGLNMAVFPSPGNTAFFHARLVMG